MCSGWREAKVWLLVLLCRQQTLSEGWVLSRGMPVRSASGRAPHAALLHVLSSSRLKRVVQSFTSVNLVTCQPAGS